MALAPKFRNWQRTLGAPEDPVATDTSSEWSAMSLLKAIFDKTAEFEDTYQPLSATLSALALGGTNSKIAFDSTNFLQLGTTNYGGGTGIPGLWIHNGTLSIETGNANLPPSDQGGIHIGMPFAKNEASSGGYGTIKIFSNNSNSPEAYLQGTIALITSATAASRRLKIEAIEQGTAYRNLTLNEGGGYVGIGVVTPLAPLHVRSGTDRNFRVSIAPSVADAVGLDIVNDAGSANVAFEIRATQTVFTAGSVAIGNLTPTGYLTLGAGTATAGNAPIKFTSGTNLTAAEAGAVEWNGVSLFVTQTSGPTRKTIGYTDFSNMAVGTGVATALGINVGSAGAFITFNGAGGTPSSLVGTNISGTAAGLTAGNVTTNANLTGAVTSVGNTTSLGSFSSANLLAALTDETGSGSAVFGTSPILTTVDARGVWTAGATWTLPAHTLGGTISGGGNQINNVIIGASTPLAATFTTISFSAITPATGPSLFYDGSQMVIASNSGGAIQFNNSSNSAANATLTDAGIFSVLRQGIVAGAATGGNKGVGTINVAADIYKNNTAYTNPDFVFEKFYTGEIVKFADRDRAASYGGLMSLPDLREFTKKNLRLPRITDDPVGLFGRGDVALEKIEEAHLYILDLHERLTTVEIQRSLH